MQKTILKVPLLSPVNKYPVSKQRKCPSTCCSHNVCDLENKLTILERNMFAQCVAYVGCEFIAKISFSKNLIR